MMRLMGSVGAGILAIVLVVMLGTAAAAAALIPGGLATIREGSSQPPPPLYLATDLALSFAAAVLGGWLAAWLSMATTWTPVFLVAGVLLIMTIISAVSSSGR